jgi:chorismate synthase
VGGLVRIEAFGLPAGLGEPVFDKLDARLAYALMGVGAVKGVAIGAGFSAARLSGGENNDAFLPEDAVSPSAGQILAPHPLANGKRYGFASNNAGGILGGMSSGAPLEVTVAVKPIASIGLEQQTITSDAGATRVTVGGRHDVCAIPRIVPVLEAMTALALADFVLLQRNARYSHI